MIKKTKEKTKAPSKAWSGRFTQGPDPRAEAYSSSLDVDIRLLPYDIVGSQAHVEMLKQQKIIRPQDAKKIQQGLQTILQKWEKGSIKILSQDEDVHMLVERCLYESIGSVAGKMHTARSRNDQVLTDLKLYLKDECEEIIRGLQTTQKVLLKLAEKHMGWVMPGYTHMQVAQPVLVSHWLLAHLEALARDEMRFTQLLSGSLDELPLGAAALAGTTHPISRKKVAAYLGFSGITANSMDTVGDRDFCLEFLSAASICAIHTSRMAEEIVWFSSSEYKFITLNQGFSTGSSIMPQKRNPDIAELIRGRSGKIIGNLVALLTVLKGLPMTYNRDLQEDKEPVFNTADTLIQTFIVLAPMLESMQMNKMVMQSACQQGFPTATEAADHLVKQGVPFREAHGVIGKVVTFAAQEGLQLEQLSLAQWKSFDSHFQPGILQAVRLHSSIERKASEGGTATRQVKVALKKTRTRLFPIKRANK
jgi:argininosuccinate lyase